MDISVVQIAFTGIFTGRFREHHLFNDIPIMHAVEFRTLDRVFGRAFSFAFTQNVNSVFSNFIFSAISSSGRVTNLTSGFDFFIFFSVVPAIGAESVGRPVGTSGHGNEKKDRDERKNLFHKHLPVLVLFQTSIGLSLII